MGQDSPTELPALSNEQIAEAEENLLRCLEAYDGEGEAGLERELDRIYPPKLSGVTAFDMDGNIMDPATVPVRGAMDALARQKKNLP